MVTVPTSRVEWLCCTTMLAALQSSVKPTERVTYQIVVDLDTEQHAKNNLNQPATASNDDESHPSKIKRRPRRQRRCFVFVCFHKFEPLSLTVFSLILNKAAQLSLTCSCHILAQITFRFLKGLRFVFPNMSLQKKKGQLSPAGRRLRGQAEPGRAHPCEIWDVRVSLFLNLFVF